MSAVALWTYKAVGPPDLVQLGSTVFFCTEQFEEFGQAQTFLTLNSVFRHVVISLVFFNYDMPGVSYSDHPLLLLMFRGNQKYYYFYEIYIGNPAGPIPDWLFTCKLRH
ncbi:MAG: hypothetical protein ACN4GM_08395, partial [Gammaproteobacteria bacterium]